MTDPYETRQVAAANAALNALGRRAREFAHAPVPEGVQRFARERLLMAVALRRPRAGIRWPSARAFGWLSLAAAVLLGVGWRWFAPERPLTYEIQGAQLLAANYLVAPSTASAPNAVKASVQFSDGSHIVATAGTRLRVDSTQSRGARVFLEQGYARAHIRHRERSSWVFVAGPFDVHVTGTSFTLAWDAAAQAVDLTLIEGSVSVESPLGSSHIVVKGGQRFRASLIAGTMQIENADGSQAPQPITRAPNPAGDARAGAATSLPLTAAEAAASRTRARQVAHGRSKHEGHAGGSRLGKSRSAAATAETSQRTAAAGPELAASDSLSSTRGEAETEVAVSDPVPASSWSDLVRAGAFDAVIKSAMTSGLSQSLERGSADSVRALADAARYTDRTALALRSLTVLRTRFPGTHQSAAAAFLLGRTYENTAQAREAKRFYELYLREAQSGEFAAEALAGKLRIVAELEGADAARPLAREYLERYPNGVHAKTARRLAESP